MSVNQSQPEIRTSDGAVATLPSPELLGERRQKYEPWAKQISRPQPDGHGAVPTRSDPLNWTPLAKPLEECTVALVSTGGVHLDDEEPFDVYTEQGDWSCRAIPADVDTARLTVTHTHYATQDALADINVMFALDRLHELRADGVIGQVSPTHFGFMGFIPDPRPLLSETVPGVVESLRSHNTDVVVLTGG